MADNQIVALNSLSGLTALTSLNLAGNDITSVSDLPSLNSLQTLDLRNNNVMDVRPLSALTTLRNLYLRGNANLVDIKLAGNTRKYASGYNATESGDDPRCGFSSGTANTDRFTR